ncbi:hypothetical protein D6B99_16365 [Arachidicoccus soli]|uniref:Transposase DDE domain-containing protein n=1 Tax=Arachidicoccus soli TaxID=2341117 RepID=A0A386HUD3_9BACT|nr:hypothetical protein D6B99_16365 [Arachidicoccus soli]
MFLDIGKLFKYIYVEREYIIDSFPVKVCYNIRIRHCKILQGRVWHGHNASKREYFYGVKVQLLITSFYFPHEMCIVPVREHEVEVLRKMRLDLLAESILLPLLTRITN